jgi:hypothetical protein
LNFKSFNQNRLISAPWAALIFKTASASLAEFDSLRGLPRTATTFMTILLRLDVESGKQISPHKNKRAVF